MANYEIFTDSSCDLPKEVIEQFDLKVMQLEVIIDDKPPVLNRDIDIKDFYNQLRNGANAKTSAVTLGFFQENMRAALEAGKDILYLGFSSGLSVTYNNGVMVLEELKEEFPDRKILYTDTLSGSMGQGLVVYYAAKLREEGKSIEEALDAVNAIVKRVHHHVTVNDLFFLKRGGRISAASAVAGTVLQFKPIIIVDENGKLSNIGKVRGRKTSINELFSMLKKVQAFDELPYVFISHSDCLDDVNHLADMIKAEFPNTEIVISDIGPVIGAHTGPGAIALCHVGTTTKGVLE